MLKKRVLLYDFMVRVTLKFLKRVLGLFLPDGGADAHGDLDVVLGGGLHIQNFISI
jgi:hypothetical protein